MKRLVILTVSGLVLFICSCTNDNNRNIPTDVITNPNSASNAQKEGLPVIEFEKELHDFGKLIQGEKVVYNFKFENTGDADLVISQVHSSCGCTVTKFPKDAIKPGEEESLKVTFDSSGRKGVQNKSITVSSNCQPNQTVIRIKAMILTP